MKKYNLLISIFCVYFLMAQPSFEWSKKVGGTSLDRCESSTIDVASNLYITGYIKSTNVDFDPSSNTSILPGTSFTSDAYISKINSQGEFVWVKGIGGSGDQEAFAITTDNKGFIYLTGKFRGTVDFNPGTDTFNLTANASYDAFILKLDTAGNFVWAKNVGASGFKYTYGKTIKVDNLGNVYVGGYFEGTTDFDPDTATANLTSGGGSDPFILKLDSDGKYKWAKKFGGIGYYEWANSIDLDTNNNVYITGYFQNTADFDPGQAEVNFTSNGSYDVFVAKLNSNGEYVWAKQIGGSASDRGKSIKVTNNGYVLVTGHFRSTVDFNPNSGTNNLTSNGTSDIFILKLKLDGNFVWAKNIGGAGVDEVYDIETDNSNNIYLTGYFYLKVDFNPDEAQDTLSTLGFYDAYLLKLNSQGQYKWANQIGGSGSSSYGYSVKINSSNDIFWSGHFSGTTDSDPTNQTNNLTSNGSDDIFYLKLSQEECTEVTNNITNTSCGIYTWNGTEYNTSGVYKDTLTNAKGCDSIVTLNLTITNIDKTISLLGKDTLKANMNGATYQWIDCNNNNSPIAGATNQMYIPKSDGNYAVIISKNSCSDTSNCKKTMGLFDIEVDFNVLVYPNPATNLVTIKLGKTRANKIELINSLGQIVSTYSINNKLEIQIETNKLKKGVYLLTIYGVKSILKKRLILVR